MHQLLKELLLREVEFMVVGGYVVNFYGYKRITGDIDLWIRPDNRTHDLKCKTQSDLADL